MHQDRAIFPFRDTESRIYRIERQRTALKARLRSVGLKQPRWSISVWVVREERQVLKYLYSEICRAVSCVVMVLTYVDTRTKENVPPCGKYWGEIKKRSIDRTCALAHSNCENWEKLHRNGQSNMYWTVFSCKLSDAARIASALSFPDLPRRWI